MADKHDSDRMNIRSMLCDYSIPQQHMNMAERQQQPLSPAATSSFDSTSPASRSAGSIGTCSTREEQHQTIDRLLADKDRLLKENDELLSSKHQMWHDYQGVAKEKDDQIEKMKLCYENADSENSELKERIERAETENSKLEEHNRGLLNALRKYMAREAEAEMGIEAAKDENDENEHDHFNQYEDRNDTDPIKGEYDAEQEHKSGNAMSTDDDDDEDRENTPYSHIFADQETHSLFDPPKQHVNVDDVAFGRHFKDNPKSSKKGKIPHRPMQGTSSIKSYFPPVGTTVHEVIDLCSDSSRSGSVEILDVRPVANQQRASFLGRPMRPRLDNNHNSNAFSLKFERSPTLPKLPFTTEVGAYESAKAQLGAMEELPNRVRSSLQHYLQEVQNRQAEGKRTGVDCKTSGCGWMRMYDRGSRTLWTVNEPTKYACRTCSKSLRACFRLDPNQKAVVLPLPPEVRDPNVTSHDDAYYISTTRTSDVPSGVWVDPRKKLDLKRKRADDSEDLGEQGEEKRVGVLSSLNEKKADTLSSPGA